MLMHALLLLLVPLSLAMLAGIGVQPCCCGDPCACSSGTGTTINALSWSATFDAGFFTSDLTPVGIDPGVCISRFSCDPGASGCYAHDYAGIHTTYCNYGSFDSTTYNGSTLALSFVGTAQPPYCPQSIGGCNPYGGLGRLTATGVDTCSGAGGDLLALLVTITPTKITAALYIPVYDCPTGCCVFYFTADVTAGGDGKFNCTAGSATLTYDNSRGGCPSGQTRVVTIDTTKSITISWA